MKPVSNHRSLAQLLPAALLVGVALALLVVRLVPSPRTTIGPLSPEQIVLQRSEALVRRLGPADATLVFSVQPGGQPAHPGDPAPYIQVDCARADGEHVASFNWDRATAELASFSRQVASDHAMETPPLTRREAQTKALGWLQKLEMLAPSDPDVAVMALPPPPGRWSFEVRAARQRVRLTLQQRTGELLWLMRHPRR